MSSLNLSIHYIFLRNQHSISPLIDPHYKINLAFSKFSTFFGSCLISSRHTTIFHTTFSRFLSQVITQGKLNSISANISCASFQSIITSKQGSIFSYNSSIISIDRCAFYSIVSSSFPACFYISNSHSTITRCTFSNCYISSTKGNGKFGNAYLCDKSDNVLYLSYTLSCAPSNENVGDSAIVLRSSKSITVSYINSSKCCGKLGSSSISTISSTCEDIKISYLTVTDAQDWCAIEFLSSSTSYCFNGNFINSEKCSICVINNQNAPTIFFKFSTFINPHNRLTYISGVTFDNCTSNIATEYEVIQQVGENYRISINLIFYKPPICGTIPYHHNVFLSISSFNIINFTPMLISLL